ncbi:MAG TPA: bifunctional precorrin-2 dehydrogenase/sirohydrochlorin ferrochelatase [Methylomirabilota bacterium]|jgi:precorrin-2 dehydrogenase/sirohydrochlorin ferrochelatase|nr:bifunctional precorrin-2 dehydrogenase/sirohydrochlorin ferrochelatase [Methylomirabilota bacterium]
MAYYPLCLEMTERRCLVVGGGPVAERKVAGLLEAGARLTVVSPSATDRLRDWARTDRVRLLLREYAASDLRGHSIVFVATDDGRVNAHVARDAREAGVLINAADDPAHCDFILPAVLRRGELTVAVSTGGTSPALARTVRDELDAYLDREDYTALARVAADARRTLRDRGTRAPWEQWRAALGGEVRELVRADRLDAARERLLDGLRG